jgi:hypothetical protein
MTWVRKTESGSRIPAAKPDSRLTSAAGSNPDNTFPFGGSGLMGADSTTVDSTSKTASATVSVASCGGSETAVAAGVSAASSRISASFAAALAFEDARLLRGAGRSVFVFLDRVFCFATIILFCGGQVGRMGPRDMPVLYGLYTVFCLHSRWRWSQLASPSASSTSPGRAEPSCVIVCDQVTRWGVTSTAEMYCRMLIALQALDFGVTRSTITLSFDKKSAARCATSV